jgi:hypothetical protein
VNAQGEYLIPAYALHPLHKEGEHALPREWIDWGATAAPAKSSPAPKPPPPEVGLPDLTGLETDDLGNGLGVTAGKDASVDYIVLRMAGKWQYALDKYGQPIPWGLLVDGKIPSWPLGSTSKVHSTCVVTVEEPKDLTVALMRKAYRWREEDEENVGKLRKFDIFCSATTGQLTCGPHKLMTKDGKPVTIRYIEGGMIPESELANESKIFLKESLKDKTDAQLNSEIITAQAAVGTANIALGEFGNHTKGLSQLVKDFNASLAKALATAGCPTESKKITDMQKMVTIKMKIDEYLPLYIKSGTSGVTSEKNSLRQAMFSGKSTPDQATKFDAFIKFINGYGDALKAANQAEVPSPATVDQNIATAREKLAATLAEKERILQGTQSALADLHAGKTKYGKIVDESA